MTLKRKLPPGIFLNVNFPLPVRGKFKGSQAVRLGRRIYSKDITKRADPRGGNYYWLVGKSVEGVAAEGTDVAAIASGSVSVTPLHIDNTDEGMLHALRKWDL